MDLTRAFVLAVMQGVTEFLPISSSGHLVLAPSILDWSDQGLGFDVAVHLGSLVAVVAYFRRDLLRMAASLGRPGSADGRLAWQIGAATVPLGIAGLLMYDIVDTYLRSPLVIAATTVGFGIVLWLADRYGPKNRDEHSLGWAGAIAIGVGQVLALVPGTSRSGITMTVGLAFGLDREAAGRFSFLLAVPAISMAGLYQSIQFAAEPDPVPWGLLGFAAAISAITAFITIAVFLKLIARIGMVWFAAYRVLLGIVIVAFFV